ncbi:GspH/FimT family pseudopilin [Polaromonas sp. DSR2-3-2]|uniref:GspH/FimT family pseudopilin n=1 Tax=unclassified Polaromonas TaxID=2638319 RepID=UPI003CED168C
MFTHSARLRSSTKGFTLIELLVVIAIVAILASLAVPSFQGLIASSNLTSTTNDLIATFARARSDAIRRGKRVTVCMSANGTQCTTTGEWSQGWITFNDNDHSGASAKVDTTDETITAISQALTNNIIIKTNLPSYVSFSSDGQTKLMDGSFGAGTLRVCSSSTALTNDTRSRDIVINSVGRVNVVKKTGVAASCPAPT